MRESFHRIRQRVRNQSKPERVKHNVMQMIRSIICEQCKLPRRTQQWFDVCTRCVRNLPKVRCGACPVRVRRLEPDSSLCRRCAGKYAKHMSSCEACGRVDYAFLSDPGLCRKCRRNSLRRIRGKSLPKNIVCGVCGLTKACPSRSEMICYACYKKRLNGDVKCTVAGCSKVIVNKKWQLCWRHNTDRLSPKLLSDYIIGYSSPFPQNVRYFLSLTAKLKASDSDSVLKTMRTKDLKRYRALGRFLKVYELPEILTWRAIHEALPKRNEPGRLRCQLVRSGLLELGNTFFQAGLLPSCDSYLNDQRLDRYLQSTPPIFVEHIAAFERWAAQGMLNPKHEISLHESQPLAITTKSILETVYAVVVFLDWCVKRNIDSLTNINHSIVATYKETLFWQQECKACRKRIPFDTTSETCSNKECQATNSY